LGFRSKSPWWILPKWEEIVCAVATASGQRRRARQGLRRLPPLIPSSRTEERGDGGMFRTYSALLLFLTVAGCATVHQEDLDVWVGHPVLDLDKHPILLTFPVVRTTAADGTEIRDYVNGRSVAQCSGGGSVFAGQVSMATYSGFTNCMQQFAACHGIFYIKNGVIDHVSAIGTGGLRCYTDASMRPGFSGSANVR
jgi:hypothetical protein